MKKGGGGIEHLQGRMTNDAATKGSLSLPNLLKGLPVAPTTKGQVHRGAMAMVGYVVYPKQAQNGEAVKDM